MVQALVELAMVNKSMYHHKIGQNDVTIRHTNTRAEEAAEYVPI